MYDKNRAAVVSVGIVKFLLDGLGIDCQACREQCVATLHVIGSGVIPDLRHAAETRNLTPRHQKRVAALIEHLADSNGTWVNPITGMFRALLALVAKEWDDDCVIRAVGMMGHIFGRHIVARVLLDELCVHHQNDKYVPRLVVAIASIRDALSATHHEYVRQIIQFTPDSEVRYRCEHLLCWITNPPVDEFEPHAGFSDPAVAVLQLLPWLERAAVIGPDTAVRDPEWLWLRSFRYRPTRVNRGPFVAMNP